MLGHIQHITTNSEEVLILYPFYLCIFDFTCFYPMIYWNSNMVAFHFFKVRKRSEVL